MSVCWGQPMLVASSCVARWLSKDTAENSPFWLCLKQNPHGDKMSYSKSDSIRETIKQTTSPMPLWYQALPFILWSWVWHWWMNMMWSVTERTQKIGVRYGGRRKTKAIFAAVFDRSDIGGCEAVFWCPALFRQLGSILAFCQRRDRLKWGTQQFCWCLYDQVNWYVFGFTARNAVTTRSSCALARE